VNNRAEPELNTVPSLVTPLSQDSSIELAERCGEPVTAAR
jgi:hypothetical protein